MIRMENGVRTVSRDVDMGRRMIEELEFAETMPVLQDMGVDSEGRIWAQRTPDRIGDAGPTDLIGADGSYLGTVKGLEQLPNAFGPGGRAAWVEFDDLGVGRVSVARLGVS